jgi:SAM-dependent methyltransferase
VSTDASWNDDMPDVYDRVLGPVLFAPFAEHVAALAAARKPQRILELAAGTGIVTSELVRALPGADIVATDLNPAMVSWAADRVPGATWLPADAQALSFPDASFDLVVCQFGVMFFPDRPGAFAEAARVLAPGGTMLFTAWDVTSTDFHVALTESLKAVLPEDTPDFLVRVVQSYRDPDVMRADLRAGGLQPDSIERCVLRGRATSARLVTEGFCRGTPLRFALQERGDLDALTEALGADMTARRGDGPIEGDLAAFVVSAHPSA